MTPQDNVTVTLKLDKVDQLVATTLLQVLASLGRIEKALVTLKAEEDQVNQAVVDLTQAVADEKGEVASAITLINGFAAIVQNALNTGDLAAVQAAVNDVKQQSADLGAAVAANPLPPTA